MKILSITAQRPDSTGSGIFLGELVRAFAGMGHEQAVIAGVYEKDRLGLPGEVLVYPVHFRTERLPFPIVGMSDEMPYESTVYSKMTPEMTRQFENAFAETIRTAGSKFMPDIVICHHLYLVTAVVRDMLPDSWVCGICHNTDLRQMKKHRLRKNYICDNIRRLNAVFAINVDQKKEIEEIYGVPGEKITIVGTGYNRNIFYNYSCVSNSNRTYDRKSMVSAGLTLRLIFAGKLSEKKGVMSLIQSLSHLPWERNYLELALAGGYGNEEEYAKIRNLSRECQYRVTFLGKLSQDELAAEYNQSDIFVLPSFSEGMPLTLIEALACGNKAVMTDLPGIKSWLLKNVPDAPVVYVEPPQMKNTDEPEPEGLRDFEFRLAMKIMECAALRPGKQPDLSRISWENICEVVLTIHSQINYNNTNY